MNLNDVVKQGVETAFETAKDFVVLGTFYSRGSAPVYDPITDTITFTANNRENVRILRTSVEAQEMEASMVTVADYKFLIPASDLAGITPDVTATVDYAGAIYNILRVKGVPGDSLWILFVRRQ